ncbi:MAG: hypothetical protein N3A71_01960 [Candidatus Dojkabacteria bacterium]|nr:hypothetical protein [Candidatus Dojkabacteria bacterium]
MKLFADKIKSILLIGVLVLIPLLSSGKARADEFYINGGLADDCHVGFTTSISYGALPAQSTGSGGITYDAAHIRGASGNGYPEATRFAPDLGTLLYPNARRYPDIATEIVVPPNSRVDIGFYDHNYSGHNTWLYDAYLFLSRTDTNAGDLGRLGAGGNYGTLSWRETSGTKNRSGRYATLPLNYNALTDSNPNYSNQTGRTIYSFTTIQPIIVQGRNVTPEFTGGGNMRLRYDLTVRNQSAYSLPNVSVSQNLPNGQTFSSTYNFAPSETKVITYFADMGTSYPTQIISAQAEIYDPNFHKETASVSASGERGIIVRRGDAGAPANWSANQPDYIASGDYISVTLIPYRTYSQQNTTTVPPQLSVIKRVSDSNESNVQTNTVEPNEDFTYTISVSNAGGIANNVRVTDDYDQNDLTIVSTNPVGVDNADIITWNLGNMVNGETRTLTINARSKTGFAHGTHQAPNNVSVIADNHNQIQDNTQTNIVAQANLIIEKTVSDSDESNVKNNNLQGDSNDSARTISYNINVRNIGTADATNVVVTDDYQENRMTIINADGGTLNNGVITWSIGTLAIGESRTFTVTALLNQGLPDLTQVLNTATVDSNETNPISDTATTLIHSPVIQVEKNSDKSEYLPGETVKWSITVRNVGTGNAYNVKVIDDLPTNGIKEIKNISDGGIFSSSNNQIYWVASTPHFILNGSYQPDSSSTWGNEKTLSYDTELIQVFDEIEIDLLNKVRVEDSARVIEAEKTVRVNSPKLDLIKEQILPESVTPGQLITYTLNYKNSGSGASIDTRITDTLPIEVDFVDFLDIEGVYNKDTHTIVWNLGDIQPGIEGKVSFRVVIKIPTPTNTRIRNISLIESPITKPVVSEVITVTTNSCCMGGMVWDDNNKNGIFDEDEDGIQNARVTLTWDKTEFTKSDSVEILTDETGHYEYTGLPYFIPITVEIIKPAGFDELTTKTTFRLVLLPPNKDGVIEDYEKDGIRYLTASGCIKFLNAGVYRDIVIADTGHSVLTPLIFGLVLILIGASGLLFYLTRTKE